MQAIPNPLQSNWSPQHDMQSNGHRSNTIFRAKGIVNKIIEVKPDENSNKKYYVANVAIGDFDYDIPVHSGIRDGDIIELIVNGVKLHNNKFQQGEFSGNR
jgi:hypothetical protein